MQNNTDIPGSAPSSIYPGTKHLILCEGKDDEGFLSSFLKSDVFSGTELSAVQVMQVQGVNNLRKTVMVLINADGFSDLSSLLIIRDADDNIRGAQDSVKSIFSAAGLPIPQNEYIWAREDSIKTAFLLMPSCSNQSQAGSLDDLCWKILSNKYGPVIQDEVNTFISSLETDQKRTFVHRKKALVHTYFSSTEQLIASGIGRAAESGAFDWTSPELVPLRDFIMSMI